MTHATDPSRVQAWEVEEPETLLETRIFTVSQRRARSRISDKAGQFIYLDAPNWVNVVAITEDDELVLIEQYRLGIDQITVEIPGGIVDAGETPLEAGVRELLEETGYEGHHAEVIGRVSPNPVIQSNWCHTVRVTGARRGREQQLDGVEEIAVRVVSMSEARRLVREGVIHHALVVAALGHHLL